MRGIFLLVALACAVIVACSTKGPDCWEPLEAATCSCPVAGEPCDFEEAGCGRGGVAAYCFDGKWIGGDTCPPGWSTGDWSTECPGRVQIGGTETTGFYYVYCCAPPSPNPFGDASAD